jgi:cytochrome P450
MALVEDYYDPWDPDFVRDPLSRYRRLLSQPPMLVHSSRLPPSLSQGVLPGKPIVLISRYDDVLTVMRDAARFSTRRPPRPEEAGSRGLNFYCAAWSREPSAPGASATSPRSSNR